MSAFSTAETEGNREDFGLRTTDSTSSDFVSLEDGSLPTVFSGHALKSVKEQKISFNLDHLCKELKIQDLGSTSGSDLSDALQNTGTFDGGDWIRGERWAEKVATHGAGTTSFCHDSQDTVVEVTPEISNSHNTDSNPGYPRMMADSVSLDQIQTQSSIGSSPGCGSTTTTDSQKSKVHFASFILEYNTSASQSFDSATVVKKKMSSDPTAEASSKPLSRKGQCGPTSGSVQEGIMAAKHKQVPPNKTVNNEVVSGLLNHVSLQPDSESSLGTPPYDGVEGVPFKSYSRSDAYNSDKENEDQNKVTMKVSPEPGGVKCDVQRTQNEANETSRQHARVAGQVNISQHQTLASTREHTKRDSPQAQGISAFPSSGVGPATSQVTKASNYLVGAGNSTSISCDSSDLVSISQVSLLRPGGILSMGKHAVSESNTLTATSESSSSTLMEDWTPKESKDLGLNIVDTGNGQVACQGSHRQRDADDINESVDVEEDRSCSSPVEITNSVLKEKEMSNELSCSPKKLNIKQQPDSEDQKEVDAHVDNHDAEAAKTPTSKCHIRRGSYTLSEPSPVLIQAKSRLEADKRHKANQEQMPQPSFNNKTDNNSQDSDQSVQKKLEFNNVDDEAAGSKVAMVMVPSIHEREGKAEHINRYLSQVQFQNSMNFQSQSLDQELDGSPQNEDVPYNELSMGSSVIDVLRSIAESHGSLGQMSDLELQSLQQQQMELARQALIEQQRRDMEELFIQQVSISYFYCLVEIQVAFNCLLELRNAKSINTLIPGAALLR